jgi:hypothetical protein
MLKPTKDKELRDDITAFLYGCFGTWKEKSFWDLSKVNQDSWRDYGNDIMQKFEKAGYRKEK